MHMRTHPVGTPGGTDAASPLPPADLLPGAEAPAARGQGQAEESEGALRLRGRCHHARTPERGRAEHGASSASSAPPRGRCRGRSLLLSWLQMGTWAPCPHDDVSGHFLVPFPGCSSQAAHAGREGSGRVLLRGCQQGKETTQPAPVLFALKGCVWVTCPPLLLCPPSASSVQGCS